MPSPRLFFPLKKWTKLTPKTIRNRRRVTLPLFHGTGQGQLFDTPWHWLQDCYSATAPSVELSFKCFSKVRSQTWVKTPSNSLQFIRCPRVLKKRVISVRTLGDCVGELAMCDPGCGDSIVYRSSRGTSSLDEELSAKRRKEKREMKDGQVIEKLLLSQREQRSKEG